MAKLLLSVHVFLILLVGASRADERKMDSIEEFLKFYYVKPDPERVPSMLDVLLKEKTLDAGIYRWPSSTTQLTMEDLGLKEKILDDQQPQTPAQRLIMGHALGHIAHGNPKLIRLYESQFAGATETGKALLVDALRICGDDATRRQLKNWSRDPAYRQQQKQLAAAAVFLADSKRRLPRDKPARSLLDLELLWADFFITGEFQPVARILDILDRPGSLRQKITDWLKNNPGNQQELLEMLTTLKLIQPHTKDVLVGGDLELILLHDAKGRLAPFGMEGAVYIGREILHLSYEELYGGLLLQRVASWSLQENLKEHPKLEEHLRKHYWERPARSQDVVKKWLRIDQPKMVLDKESERLQGTWQVIAWEEEDSQPHDPKVDDPKVNAEILKFVRWRFEDDEWIKTRAFTITTNGKTKDKGQGSTTMSTYKIDASKSPKQITATTVGCFNEEIVIRATYKFEGDVLRVCMSKNEQMQTEFSGKKGSDCILVTLKKVPDR